MNSLFVARIHNGSLGTAVHVNSMEDGETVIRAWVKDAFNRELTQEENEILEETAEFIDNSDSDNNFTFSIGEIENVDN